MTPIDKAIELLIEYKQTGDREKASDAAHMIAKMLDESKTCRGCGCQISSLRRYCDECLPAAKAKGGYKKWENERKRKEEKLV